MESNLNFRNFVVPRFQFEKTEIDIEKSSFEIQPQALISRKKQQFHINIELELLNKENQFILKMTSVGIFNYTAQEEELLLNFMSVNGPAIVFPYIRSFISNLTSLSGFETVTLPTLNLSGFKEDLIKNLIDLDKKMTNE